MTRRQQGELLDILGTLSAAQQRRVLNFARSLAAARTEGVKGKKLLRFAGAIPSEELVRMAQAIEEGCEQVDVHAW